MRLDPFRYEHTNYAAEMILRWQKQNPARSSSYSDVKCWNRYVGRDAGGMPFIPSHVSLVFASLYFTHTASESVAVLLGAGTRGFVPLIRRGSSPRTGLEAPVLLCTQMVTGSQIPSLHDTLSDAQGTG